ncbi:MAG: rhodanese-related sulfurtransferase [Patescibacteria group bacterium]
MKISKREQYKSREERRREVANDGIERITLSFYKYVPIDNPETVRDELFEKWYTLGCLGRIYLAHEGINAQMNVPKDNWDTFDAHLKSIPEFNDIPYKIAINQDNTSFYKLTVKIKEKIVADGLDDESFDPSNTGAYLSAKEMNEYINDPESVVIDMRNAYESEIGYFENAHRMQVDTFREQLAKVGEEFSDKKDTKIALYCTGGIRCEKASAWMKHQGFRNVRHIKGGIISYRHQVEEEGIENKFRGTNFVFDERLGERIGEEPVSYCHLCNKQKTDQYYHCGYVPCHALHLACDKCHGAKHGYCSSRCRVLNSLPSKINKRIARYISRRASRNPLYRKRRLV